MSRALVNTVDNERYATKKDRNIYSILKCDIYTNNQILDDKAKKAWEHSVR